MKISVTGHRPNKLGGYSFDVYCKLMDVFHSWLYKNQEVDTVISGMALGWDQAVCEATLHMKIDLGRPIHLVAAIPCLGQDKMWPSKSQKEYKKLLSRCDEVVYVSNQPYFPSCMQERNCFMVNNSELVVALYNGDLSGGTFNCLQYAKKQNKPIINLWSEYVKQK